MSVATTYAEALYESAADQHAVEPVARDVAAFAEGVAGSEELRAVLENPEIEVRQKKAAVAALTEDAHPLVRNFLQVLLDRGRIEDLPEIAEAVADRVARAQGRLEVTAVTAVPLADDLRERIIARIRQETGSEVDLSETIDPEIVGGLVLRVGQSVVDGSVRHRIEELRERLRAAPVDAAAAASEPDALASPQT
jgi:F-type H+-transporting ATPase subunit delta